MKKVATLTKTYRRLADHPVGGLLVEDLAASREHGLVTARVGIAPDGNPIVYARDEAVAKRIGEAMQNQTAVHVRPIPPLDMEDFRLLSRQAEKALGVRALPKKADAEGPDGMSHAYGAAVEAALVDTCGIEPSDARAMVERHATTIANAYRQGQLPPEATARGLAVLRQAEDGVT